MTAVRGGAGRGGWRAEALPRHAGEVPVAGGPAAVRRARARAVLALTLMLVVVAGRTARADSPDPGISGSVRGSAVGGGVLTIEIDAQKVGGWQGLHELEVDLVVAGSVADAMTYEVENDLLDLGSSAVFAGTGSRATGSYLAVDGADIVVTTGGANLAMTLKADVLRAIPASARFRLSVVDDLGRRTTVVRRIRASATSGGLSWGTVLAAILVALLLGAFLGNLVASRRRPVPRLSVYSAIQRRIGPERPPDSSP